ncbi:DUF488 domain-containing protein [uncultured Bifidobacterium sp.]|uniref:DUF488 domain-containing protein n=1 Tax=uncultured Bifidobacterium sp. TaxID=165187 RepID=UPI00261E78EC|nr:DUF488 domain-containing protein [uncultured Bifidobacterium sp.]
MGVIRLARVYAGRGGDDGYRILVDRLWPRGLSKEKAAIDMWAKECAPTSDLRRWFGHQPERFEEFARRYTSELEANPHLDEIRDALKSEDVVTLVYAAKDSERNNAVVLREYLMTSAIGANS